MQNMTIMAAMLFTVSAVGFAGIEDFDTTESIIQLHDLKSGGPAKGGIPAISKPHFLDIDRLQYVESISDDELVVGLSVEGTHKAYPLNILTWHEIVNDTIKDVPVAVTYCPLTRSAIVFNRIMSQEQLSFGVSGLLYNNNLVMYDRTNDILWPQLQMGAVTGKFSSRDLTIIPSLVTTWGEWRKKHPTTTVLSQRTGYRRAYSVNPYEQYHRSTSQIMFPMKRIDRRLKPKSLVVGIRIGNTSKAYPLKNIFNSKQPLHDVIDEQQVIVIADSDQTGYITDESGVMLNGIVTYWFAWQAFNKHTLIYH